MEWIAGALKLFSCCCGGKGSGNALVLKVSCNLACCKGKTITFSFKIEIRFFLKISYRV